ncbi:unnamed protein product [Hyaloperonospora brassicae]|uniref:Sulfatase N-terminal domain-containing protein n=1 Tax=Hyaloperonospora brassicae TaxID=162125 RepID=A0AAV0UYV1_HYABA|nr:unnamed protein product [Hyaloperonospora brassicae]
MIQLTSDDDDDRPQPTPDSPVDTDVAHSPSASTPTWSITSRTPPLLASRPYLSWLFVYSSVLLVFLCYRLFSLPALMSMYATSKDATSRVVLATLTLGLVEDFVCATYFVSTLWLVDVSLRYVRQQSSRTASNHSALVARGISVATFTASWLLLVALLLPFWTDLLLVRLRGMRFTFALVAMAISEQDNISAVPIAIDEWYEGYVHATVLVLVVTLFASARTWTAYMDLTSWHPIRLVHCLRATAIEEEQKRLRDARTDTAAATRSPKSVTWKAPPGEADATPLYMVVRVAETAASGATEASKTLMDQHENNRLLLQSHSRRPKWNVHVQQGLVAVLSLLALPVLAVLASRSTSPLVAYAALNTSLNELLGGVLQPTLPNLSVSLPWPEKFIHVETEDYRLFGSHSLYRQTTGFHGEVAFDVTVARDDPPNVLVLVVESFRFHDSRYLVGDDDPSQLFRGSNLTVTPHFDRWAARGVALRNLWSSWRTSRSVESVLFGQLPYDSTTASGTTGGRNDTKLSGLPQLFAAKGYETVFTTGCKTDYDAWDRFLPSHGFDTVWGREDMMALAETDLGITPDEWYGAEQRGFNWGVHDDLSFQLLGDLLLNKTREQSARRATLKPKTPLFLTHYTISSHVDFKQRPRWFDEAAKPNFSALYEGQPYADNIQNYHEIRYFTDLELGKFMDRMADAGVLNDTIVVIVGDHGQGPEFGNNVPEDRDVSATRVAGAIIAEGRLADAAGLVIDDAAEQYDLLNTLADITGVPEGGFAQSGVGRSLKRKVKFGERIVYSNNPTRKMSIVRGHERLRYDRVTDSVLLHDVDTDHDMAVDRFPGLAAKEQAEWLRRRDEGRRVNEYFTKRWENECLLAPECNGTSSTS